MEFPDADPPDGVQLRPAIDRFAHPDLFANWKGVGFIVYSFGIHFFKLLFFHSFKIAYYYCEI